MYVRQACYLKELAQRNKVSQKKLVAEVVKIGLCEIEQWGTGDGDVSIVEMRALIRVGFYPFKPSIVENVPDAVI